MGVKEPYFEKIRNYKRSIMRSHGSYVGIGQTNMETVQFYTKFVQTHLFLRIVIAEVSQSQRLKIPISAHVKRYRTSNNSENTEVCTHFLTTYEVLCIVHFLRWFPLIGILYDLL